MIMSSTNNLFFEYLSAYGVHVALCTILSAVTAYRREISCNRSYHKDDDDDNDDVVDVDVDDYDDCGIREEKSSDDNPSSNNNNSNNSNNRTKDDCTTIAILADNDNDNKNTTIFNVDERKELMTEQLLDGAGMYCSGKPIMNFAELLWLGLEYYDYIVDKNENEKDGSSTLNNLTPENLLNRVGNYASFPEPIMATIALFVLWKKTAKKRSMQLLTSPLPSLTLTSSSSSFSSSFVTIRTLVVILL